MVPRFDFGALRSLFSSIFVRCAGIMAITTFIVAGALALQSNRLIDSLAHQAVADMAKNIVSEKASALVAPLRFNAQAKIDEVIHEAMVAAGDAAVGMVVVDAKGTVLAASTMQDPLRSEIQDQAKQSLEAGTDIVAENGLSLSMLLKQDAASPALGAVSMRWSNAHAMAVVNERKMVAFSWALFIFVAMLVLTVLVLRRSIGTPLAEVSKTISSVAQGEYDLQSNLVHRKDEVGKIAIDLVSLTSKLREAKDAEQKRSALHQEQRAVVETLGGALTALSKGDLSVLLETEFPSEYERLRRDYNDAVTSLSEVVQLVGKNAGSIDSGASEIAQSSDDLSRRTENQAATLEETAASLEELLVSVKSAAGNAANADSAVRKARDLVTRNGTVMSQAVIAMSAIGKSSSQISDIITVIDDIAFQTNLLALNAGVEAARAGSSGKGFAVVASEVRALAQRSSDAARQIKDLIIGSADEVQNGVRLVEKAGVALDEVIDQVSAISDLVADISSTAAEQAQGLNEINSGVSTLDSVTQKNAAMVEQTTASAHMLRTEAVSLGKLMARFTLGTGTLRPETVRTLDGSDAANLSEEDRLTRNVA